MKPIKLVLQAFGPFGGRQEIDFSLIDDEGVFLITGETGSGKTTLLDAMVFALYGRASGESRASSAFKSHHAGDDVLCRVEFAFSLHGKPYHIARTPQQLCGKKRGTGLRAVNETAELTLPDGSILTGPREVDPKICQIIGLNREQFKQTIVLAQGEFLALLAANSTKKQKMFSQIFNTAPYREVAEELTLELKSLEQALAGEQSAVARAVEELARLGHKALDTPGAAFLPMGEINRVAEDGMALEQLRMERIAGDIAALEQQRLSLNLEGAKAHNQKLSSLEALVRDMTELDARLPEVEAQKQSLAYLRAAKELAAQESLLERNKTYLAEAEARLDDLSGRLEAHRPVFARARERYALTDSLDLQIQPLYREIEELRRREEEATAQGELRDALALNQRRVQKAAENLGELELLQKRQRRRAEIAVMEGILHAAARLEEGEAAFREARAQADKAKRRYDALLAAYLEGQAAVLAGGLEEDRPCPVCGSTAHPSPAVGGRDIGEKDLKDAEEKLQQSRRKEQEAEVAAARQKEQLTLRLDSGAITHPAEAAQALEALKAEEAADLAAHPGLPAPPQDISASLDKLRELLAALREEGSALTARISPDTEDPTLLKARREALEEESAALKARQKADTDAYLEAKAALDRLTTEKTEADGNLGRTREHFRRQEAQFRQLLAQSGFADYGGYQAVKPQIPQIEEREQAIGRYHSRRTEAAAKIEALKEETGDRPPADLEALQAAWDRLTEETEEKRRAQSDAAAYLRDSRRRLSEIAAIRGRTEKLTVRYNAVRELESAAKGRSAPHIDFERYILISYFNDIIGQANIYLQKMTDSRYRLHHKAKGTSRTAGLDLEVFDAHTGTRRDVSTLSGGEGFKAALSLAMGLSSIVQIYAGGVSLGAIFIDEGFGSLDEKSLNSAVRTLLSLGRQGRMVGIISHVRELRDHIPAKLVITSSPGGSRAKFQLP